MCSIKKEPPVVFYKKSGFNFTKLSGKHLYRSVSNKATGLKLKAYNITKKRLRHRCFLVTSAKFIRTPPGDSCYL